MRLLVLLFCMTWTALFAGGPKRVATFERALWPYTISDKASFDKASRHEIANYIKIFESTVLNTQADLKTFTGLKKVNLSSVSHWKEKTEKYLYSNFLFSQKSCETNDGLCRKVDKRTSLKQIIQSYTPEKELTAWNKASRKFFEYYLYEQVRLAALFPRITSEIDILDQSESQGFEYKDGEFLLTFDDGPKFSLTHKLITKMNQLDISGLFFVLGKNLEKTLKNHSVQNIQSLYDGQCVGSHSFVHKAHPKLKNWQYYYDKTRKLIVPNNLQGTSEEKIWFRPPYGQRQLALIEHLKDLGDRVMLWNIDSQDWNRKLTAKQIENRVITLMLLHRKGIILFHDIHTKALKSLEALNTLRVNKAIVWRKCQSVRP